MSDAIVIIQDAVSGLVTVPTAIALLINAFPWWLSFSLGLAVVLGIVLIIIRIVT